MARPHLLTGELEKPIARILDQGTSPESTETIDEILVPMAYG